MYFWNAYPFVRLALALIIGITLFDQSPTLWEHQVFVFFGLTVAVIFAQYLSKQVGFYEARHINGVLSLAFIVLIGGYLAKNKYHSHSIKHYKNIEEPILGFEGIVSSSPSERTQYFRYELNLTQFINDSLGGIEGTIFLYIRKDSVNHIFQYGDILRVAGSFYAVPPPSNPNEFDYKAYLARQNIYSHSFVNRDEVQKAGNSPPSHILKWALKLREKASTIIDYNITSSKENAIAKALILGVKDHLDNDIKQAYASAGAMHVLAVSGLHVGIVYLLLELVFGRLKHHSPAGQKLFTFLSVAAIWLYALITGLSPSVLRAATMFSMVAIGEVNTRKGNIYNTLGLSAFILLLSDPYLIYSVGFQLSYSAVFGIVYLQPRLYRLLSFSSRVGDKAWSITCVSIAAQLSTFPLSAYYFHQFPTYFLVSNLVVIPAAFITLLLGIIMLITFPIFNLIGEGIGYVLEKAFYILNIIMGWIQQLPHSVIDWIYIDRTGLILIYAIIISLVVGLQSRSFKTLIVTTTISILLIGNLALQHYKVDCNRKLIFYELKNATAIDVIDRYQATLLIDQLQAEDASAFAFQVNPFRLANGLPPMSGSYKPIATVFQEVDALRVGRLQGRNILILDTTTFHLKITSRVSVDLILIENEAVKSLKWLTENFDAKHIIIGNTNSYYYCNAKREEANSLGLEIHSLRHQGAFVLKTGHKKRANHGLALFTTNPD